MFTKIIIVLTIFLIASLFAIVFIQDRDIKNLRFDESCWRHQSEIWRGMYEREVTKNYNTENKST